MLWILNSELNSLFSSTPPAVQAVGSREMLPWSALICSALEQRRDPSTDQTQGPPTWVPSYENRRGKAAEARALFHSVPAKRHRHFNAMA